MLPSSASFGIRADRAEKTVDWRCRDLCGPGNGGESRLANHHIVRTGNRRYGCGSRGFSGAMVHLLN